jgi:predicted transglutaminase-like cysteine proteinase
MISINDRAGSDSYAVLCWLRALLMYVVRTSSPQPPLWLAMILLGLGSGPATPLPLADPFIIDWQQLRQAASAHGSEALQRVDAWQDLLESVTDASPGVQLKRVNDFFNSRIDWRSDDQIWSQRDYWATPLEMLARGEGDCEDFSIAKYVSLLALGIPVEQLRLSYVRAQRLATGTSIAHMVLAYYPTAGQSMSESSVGTREPLILDNLAVDILPASRRTDLTPIFGFNSAGIWVGGERAPRSRDSSARLSRWRDLLRRLQDEGIPAY